MGAAMGNLKICYALKGIRLAKGEKARGQIIIGTPGTTMDWVIKYKSINPHHIKVLFWKLFYEILKLKKKLFWTFFLNIFFNLFFQYNFVPNFSVYFVCWNFVLDPFFTFFWNFFLNLFKHKILELFFEPF